MMIPAGVAPHREIDPEPGADVRLEMVRLAAEGDELLEASDVEVARDEPSWTFRTLELLHEARPGDEITLLMGADVAESLGSWKNPERVLEMAEVGVAGRPGSILDEAESVLEGLGRSVRGDQDAGAGSFFYAGAAAGCRWEVDSVSGAGSGARVDRGERALPMSEREAAVARARAEAPDSSLDLARRVAAIADDKLGEDIVVLDMRELVSYTDFLVLVTARNERLAKAIADDVHLQLKGDGMLPSRDRGRAGGAMGASRLSRLRSACLRSRGARALPPRAAVGRGAAGRAVARSIAELG